VIAKLEGDIQQLTADVDNLKIRSPVVRFQNISADGRRLEFMTGLSPEYWKTLWDLLGPLFQVYCKFYSLVKGCYVLHVSIRQQNQW